MTDDPLEISVTNVKALLAAEEPVLLVDCREPLETDFTCIAGSAPIPMSQLAERIEELEPHKQDQIVFYCHHGVRSLRVINWLRQQGFSGAQSMAGGIDCWSQEIDPAVPRYQLSFHGLSPLEAADDDPV